MFFVLDRSIEHLFFSSLKVSGKVHDMIKQALCQALQETSKSEKLLQKLLGKTLAPRATQCCETTIDLVEDVKDAERALDRAEKRKKNSDGTPVSLDQYQVLLNSLAEKCDALCEQNELAAMHLKAL